MAVNVELNDFSYDEIEEFAEDNLDMIKVDDITLEYLHEKYDIFEFLEDLGGIQTPNFYYPNNSILIVDAYDRLNRNIDKIPINALNKFLDDHNCI